MSNSLRLKNISKYSEAYQLFIFFTLLILSKQEYIISRLYNYSVSTKIWNISEKYIYYIDIQDYKLDEENILQILCEDRKIIYDLNSSIIDESILNKKDENINQKDIIVIRNIKKNFTLKRRLATKLFYYQIIIKKTEENQKNFVILFEPNLEYNDTKIQLYVSTPIPNFNIYQNNIDGGNIFEKTFYMDNSIEKFFRFNLINISLEQANLILYLNDKEVSTFYINSIASNEIKAKLYCIEKNTTSELNHTIYLALLGEPKATKIQIMMDYHDIKYFYSLSRNDTSMYIERLNCKKDFFIFENYYKYEKTYFNYHLHILPYYGDYELVYYDNILDININNIFKPNNEIHIAENIVQISSYFNILKLSCKTPSLIKLKYLKENAIKSNLIEGNEIITYMYPNRYDNIKIITDSSDKIFKLYLGFFEDNKLDPKTIKIYMGINKNEYDLTNENTSSRKTFFLKKIFHEKNARNNLLDFRIFSPTYIKLYLVSNQYYQNLVEGLNIINSETKAFAFKVRKDIIFDYFILVLYSHNKTYLVSIDYELKIVDKSDIDSGKVLVGINPIKDYNKNEIIIKFSNPYNKFNLKIKETDTVYLLGSFVFTDKNKYPIYIDIKYYYDNKIITLEKSQPKILLINKEYKISGDEKYLEKNKIFLSLNKCNMKKIYFLKSYYENVKNMIVENIIKEKRNILSYGNLFNNTRFILFSNDTSYSISNNNNDSNSLKLASYYDNGDIYMNYFSLKESLFNAIKITKDYSISYSDNRNKITLKWNDYISNKKIINDLKVNYSLYILPKISPINTVCQMSLIPPNISLINKDEYIINLSKGSYKIGIIASVVNDEFPIVSFYDFLNLNVPMRINYFLIIFVAVGVCILIIIIILCIFCKKKWDDEENMRLSKRVNMISMAKIFGYDDEQEEEILKNDEEDILKNESKKIRKDENDDNSNEEDNIINFPTD